MIEEPHGRIEIEGTVTFPKEAREELLRQIAYEVPPKAIPWGWIVATGSLILSLIICITKK